VSLLTTFKRAEWAAQAANAHCSILHIVNIAQFGRKVSRVTVGSALISKSSYLLI
jgi:hypothetical protein